MPDRGVDPMVRAGSGAERDGEWAAIDRLRRLGDQLVGELAAIYREDVPARLAAARAALGRGDGIALAAAVHAVKSSSAQLGAQSLAAACEDAEAAAEAGDLARAREHLALAEGRYATFVAWLAEHVGALTPAAPAGQREGTPSAGARAVIALIEDNVDNRLLVDAILGERFELDEYATGAAALAGMSRRTPDLVLLDVSLPGMDGLEVLSRMRLDRVLAGVPVVALTAHAMAGDRERYLDAGFDEYVPKPIVDEYALTGAVERLLARGVRGTGTGEGLDGEPGR